MKVLVTGAAATWGIALSERLVALGHDVIAYDLRGEGVPSGARFVEGDVRDFDRLDEAARECEAGIHLAVVSEGWQAKDILSVNVLGTYGFLHAARNARFRNA